MLKKIFKTPLSETIKTKKQNSIRICFKDEFVIYY